jgi:hypothetical protein
LAPGSRALALLGSTLAMLIAIPLRAEAAPASGAPLRLTVLVDAGAGDLPFADALATEVAGLDVEVVVRPFAASETEISARLARARQEAARPEVAVALWLERDARGARLFLVDHASGDVVVKGVPPLPGDPRQAGRISAVVARGMLRGVLATVPTLVVSPRPPESAPPPATPGSGGPPAMASSSSPARPPRPAGQDRFALGVGYAIAWVAPPGGPHHGGEVMARWRVRGPLLVGLSATAYGPVTVDSAGATTRFSLFAVKATAAAAFPLGRRAEVGVVGGVGALVARAESRLGAGSSDNLSGVPAVHLALHLDVALMSHLHAGVRAGFATLLNRPRYLVGSTEVAQLQPVAPEGGLELVWRFP